MKKIKPFISLSLVSIFIIVIAACNNNGNQPANPSTRNTENRDPAGNADRSHGFDRRISYIEYTQHAKCRMDCRHISKAEVEEIMQKGTINDRKSDRNGRPCPTYALEGVTQDQQHVRIVYAQCDLQTKVVTVIDLDTDWTCHCPGDDH